MKKIYSAPVVEVYELRCEAVIATSIGVSDDQLDANSAFINQKDMWGNNIFW